MALRGYNVTIDGENATPQTLNRWLRKTNGYKKFLLITVRYVCAGGDCCNLVLDAPNNLAPERIRNLGEPDVHPLRVIVTPLGSLLAHFGEVDR